MWEAAMLAGHRKLDNLVVIVDNNGLQIDGNIADVNSPYPIDKKFDAFNFHVINIDGHNFDEIAAAFKEAKEVKGKPTAIIAKTIKRKKMFLSWKMKLLGMEQLQMKNSMQWQWQI